MSPGSLRSGYELRTDCAHCACEGSRIETWDPDALACRYDTPLSATCRVCGHTVRSVVLGVDAHLEDVTPPRRPASLAELEAALDAWAPLEGAGDRQGLVDAYFVLRSPAEVFAALSRGERVETTFDVTDFLFSGGAGTAAAGEPAVMREREEEASPVTVRIPQPVSIRRIGGARDELLALASVAAADGEAGPDDLAVLERAAQKRGVPLLPLADVRVYRPNEVDPPPTLVDRERVLEEMFQMAWSDGQMDDSEMRVIKSFARAWGIDPERVREWVELYSFGDANRFERWFRRIGFFLFPAR